MYILRAYDQAGDTGYYTGKAGPEWINNQSTNAFTYESIDVAASKIRQFNRMTEIHKIQFRVEAI